jgi:hypothetical protein
MSEIRNKKSFNTVATTKKGNFNVTITIFEQICSGFSFKNEWLIQREAVVVIDNKEFEASFDEHKSDRVKSMEVAKYFGIQGEVALAVDGSEAAKYIADIKQGKMDFNSKCLRELEAEQKMFEKNHNL